jgi:hypothetical protein
MNRVKNFIIAGLGLMVLALSLSLSGAGSAIAQRAEDCVRICDESPIRTLAQGVTLITGTVRVESSAREPLYVKPGLVVTDVFQKQLNIFLQPGIPEATASFSVPAGKLLSIDDVLAKATMGHPNQIPDITIKTTVNGVAVEHPLALSWAWANWTIQKPGTIYADPGSDVTVVFSTHSFYGNAGENTGAALKLSLTGHYIDQ